MRHHVIHVTCASHQVFCTVRSDPNHLSTCGSSSDDCKRLALVTPMSGTGTVIPFMWSAEDVSLTEAAPWASGWRSPPLQKSRVGKGLVSRCKCRRRYHALSKYKRLWMSMRDFANRSRNSRSKHLWQAARAASRKTFVLKFAPRVGRKASSDHA